MSVDILLADDDPQIAADIGELLEKEGYLLTIADNGLDALRIIQEDKPDLAILDVDMPGLSGLEVCRAVRKHSAMPLVLLSALNSEHDGNAGYEAQANCYITKGPSADWQLKNQIKLLLQPDGQFKNRYVLGNTEVCTRTQSVHINSVQADIDSAERATLLALIRKQGDLASKQELSVELLNCDYDCSSRALDGRISRLRKALVFYGSSLKIETVRGEGYLIFAVE
jgi:DNA-binding response OmpR family regulator